MRSPQFLVAVVFGFLGLFMSNQRAHAVEEPQWSLVYEDGPLAIRDYARTVVAETRVSGERGAAIIRTRPHCARASKRAARPRLAMSVAPSTTHPGPSHGRAVTRSWSCCSDADRNGRLHALLPHKWEFKMTVTMLQRLSVLAAACTAVGASFLQATGALRLTPAEFANAGASTVRAASYAFAIWGLIYAGLLIYAVYQLIPGWANEIVLRRFGWPSALSMLAIGAWLVAAGADWRWATVALIAFAALVLIIPLASPTQPTPRRDAILIATPLALLAGWLTIATALNTITVLTAEGFVQDSVATWWANGFIGVAAAVAIVVSLRSDALAYPLPLIWGLLAVFVAERDHRPEAAGFAAACALLLAVILVWRAARLVKLKAQ